MVKAIRMATARNRKENKMFDCNHMASSRVRMITICSCFGCKHKSNLDCGRFSFIADSEHERRMKWISSTTMGEILPLKFEKCCFRYSLLYGCAIYVTVEVYLWAVFSFASVYTEFKMIENRDVGAFKNFTTNSSYYVTTFGDTAAEIGSGIICECSAIEHWLHKSSGKRLLVKGLQKIDFSPCLFTVTQIAINGFLSVGFVLYCLFAVILLIGISEVKILRKRDKIVKKLLRAFESSFCCDVKNQADFYSLDCIISLSWPSTFIFSEKFGIFCALSRLGYDFSLSLTGWALHCIAFSEHCHV